LVAQPRRITDRRPDAGLSSFPPPRTMGGSVRGERPL
jgi:hypothetical protein